jgi:hypothetical protein
MPDLYIHIKITFVLLPMLTESEPNKNMENNVKSEDHSAVWHPVNSDVISA